MKSKYQSKNSTLEIFLWEKTKQKHCDFVVSFLSKFFFKVNIIVAPLQELFIQYSTTVHS